MDIKKVNEALGRAKAQYLKGNTVTSLKNCILGLDEITRSQQTPPTEIRTLLRAVIQDYSSTNEFKEILGANLSYQPGQEKALFINIKKLYLALTKVEKESYEAASVRKRAMDAAILQGKKHLAANSASDADASFQEAVKLYLDEHHLFFHLGKLLFEAKQPIRAVPYLKKAQELNPSSEEILKLYNEALEFRTKRNS